MAMGVNWCSVLKEYADAKKLSGPYYEMHSSGPQHHLTFHVKVKLDTFTAEGTGATKKAAKAHAAQLLMKVINPGGAKPQSHVSKRKRDLCNTINFIGKLQEFCQRRKLDLPLYEEEVCEPLEYKIICIVKLQLQKFRGYLPLITHGSGGSKRAAKQSSAAAMMKILSGIIEHECTFDAVD